MADFFCPQPLNHWSRNDFNNFIGDFDDFLEGGPRYLNNKLAPLVRFTVDKLSQNGCFDMTVDSYFDYYLAGAFETCTALREEMLQMQRQLDAETGCTQSTTCNRLLMQS